MTRRIALASVVLTAVLAIVAALVLTACAPAPPSEAPGIVGVVTSLVPGAERPGSILVEGAAQSGAVADKAQVSIGEATQVFAPDGTPAAASTIVSGATVKVWFTGSVAESYPVQGSAKAIQLIRAP